MDDRKPIVGQQTYKGQRFPWGVFVQEHFFGEQGILEFIVDNLGVSGADPEDHGKTYFLVQSKPGSMSGRSFYSLDAAIIHCVAYKHTDDDKLTEYLLKLIGIQ